MKPDVFKTRKNHLFAMPVVGMLLLVGAFALLINADADAAPEPELVQRHWQLDFSSAAPRAIAVKNLRGQYEWFWYVTYKVENNTGRERLFTPEIVVGTDKGDIVRAGRNVPTRVFDAVKKQVGNRLLESPTAVVGRLLRGEDHAKESVAIWPAFKHNIDMVTVYFGGLSGETKVVTTPDPADPSKKKEFVLTKTIEMKYSFPGAPLSPQDQAVVTGPKKWIMR